MDNHLPSPSYRETRDVNAADKRYFTLVLTNRSLDVPLPIHCLFCGFTIFESNSLPETVIDEMLMVKDTKRSIDVRCKKCKATCRIT